MLDFFRTRPLALLTRAPQARRRSLRYSAGQSSEMLEERCLLSAVMAGGVESSVAAECDLVDAAAQTRKATGHSKNAQKANTFPDVAGTWTFVTDPGGANIVGVLELTQKGKKINGTLTNEFQPPGTFKGKFVNAKAEFTTIVGKFLNRSISSKQIKFGCELVGELLEGKYQNFEGMAQGPEGDVPFNGTRNNP